MASFANTILYLTKLSLFRLGDQRWSNKVKASRTNQKPGLMAWLSELLDFILT